MNPSRQHIQHRYPHTLTDSASALSVPTLFICFMQTHCFIVTQTNLASNLEAPTTSSPFVSCKAFLPNSPEGCEEHEESLSVFCLDDMEPLCKQCAAVNHAGHKIYLLTEAASDCKEELRTSVNGLKKKMMDFEKVAQTCEHASKHNQAEAKVTEECMKKEFESLHQFLREEEAARLLALREKQEKKKREAVDSIDRMNQVIKSLEEKIQLIEEELNTGGDGAEFSEHYQDTLNSTWAGRSVPQQVSRPLIDVAKHLGNLQYGVWEKMKHIAPYTPVTLDPRTAGQSLRVSPGLNSFHFTPGPSQDAAFSVPANPERFHPYSCILAREGFDSGVHCWHIEVGDTNNWTVGVAAQSVSRRTEFEACPEAGLWCISLRDGKYQALTTPSEDLNLNNSPHLRRVRVKLDWVEGTLKFINADTATHLFTFRYCFTEKVYPYFESISLCGGLALLAQSVNIRVGSDYVPVEDTAITEGDRVMNSKSCTERDIDTASTNSSKMSESRCLTEEKNSAIGSVREEKNTKPQGCTRKDQLIKTKLAGKEKKKDKNRAASPGSVLTTMFH